MILIAVVLVGLYELGDSDPGNWVALKKGLDHGPAMVLAALILAMVAILRLHARTRPSRFARGFGVVLLGLMITAELFLNFVVNGLLAQQWHVTRHVAAPDGRPDQLLVYRGMDVIDPLWALSIRQGRGLTAREWNFACINGDDPEFGLYSVAWDGPTRIVVVTGADTKQTHVVNIDGTSGRPTGRADTWDGCID